MGEDSDFKAAAPDIEATCTDLGRLAQVWGDATVTLEEIARKSSEELWKARLSEKWPGSPWNPNQPWDPDDPTTAPAPLPGWPSDFLELYRAYRDAIEFLRGLAEAAGERAGDQVMKVPVPPPLEQYKVYHATRVATTVEAGLSIPIGILGIATLPEQVVHAPGQISAGFKTAFDNTKDWDERLKGLAQAAGAIGLLASLATVALKVGPKFKGPAVRFIASEEGAVFGAPAAKAQILSRLGVVSEAAMFDELLQRIRSSGMGDTKLGGRCVEAATDLKPRIPGSKDVHIGKLDHCYLELETPDGIVRIDPTLRDFLQTTNQPVSDRLCL